MSRTTRACLGIVVGYAVLGLGTSAQAEPVIAVIGGGVADTPEVTFLDTGAAGSADDGADCVEAAGVTTCTAGLAGVAAGSADPRATSAALIAADNDATDGFEGVCPTCRIVNIRTTSAQISYSVSRGDPNDPTTLTDALAQENLQKAVQAKKNLAEALRAAVGKIKAAKPEGASVAKGVILVLSDRDLTAQPTADPDDELQQLLHAIYDQTAGSVAEGTSILVVAPAGNGEPVGDPNVDATVVRYPTDAPSYPCAYGYGAGGEPKTVVCVGALDTQGPSTATEPRRSVFSNFGEWVDVWAPGQHIPTGLSGDQAYVYDTGAAAAIVAAVAANLQDDAEPRTPAQIRDDLLFTKAIEVYSQRFVEAR